MNVSEDPGEVDLRPLSARSVVLSLLLGAHPPELPVRDLLRAVEPLGVAGSTLRAALSRMVAMRRPADHGRGLPAQRPPAGTPAPPGRRRAPRDPPLGRRLGDDRRHRDRPRPRRTRRPARQVDHPPARGTPRGVWLRPANLLRPRPDELGAVARHFTTRPEEPARQLATNLWPLDAWAKTAEALLDRITATADHPADRFTVLAAAVRHLLADPVLPAELLPADWPGAALRTEYTRHRRELIATTLGNPA